jgi:hypothetical protein
MDRLERIMVEHATGKIGDRATLVEAMAYLLSATEDKRVTQQWGTGWFHVYGHITYQVLEKHKLLISTQDTQIVHAYGALELTSYEEENLLVPLLKVIRRVVVREGRQAAVSGAASLQAACSSQQYPTFYHVALLMEKELKRGCKVDKKQIPDSSATE